MKGVRDGSRRVAVVGGGITGLAAAHRLGEIAGPGIPLSVDLFEAADRPGGVIRTLARGRFLVEPGPDSFITDRPGAIRLAGRIGLAERMIPVRARFARSFVVRAGRLHPTPAGFYLVAPSRILPFLTTPLLGLRGKIRAGLDLILPARTDDADESIGEFVLRRLGRETLDRIAQPMITAVHGGDPMKLSLL
ncbi:MAG: protoporphyrinogen oxidase, partial [Acidobacteria bacterium]|nr:protoporphyrinogen oxidase [Acidobacteriota bacterium]